MHSSVQDPIPLQPFRLFPYYVEFSFEFIIRDICSKKYCLISGSAPFAISLFGIIPWYFTESYFADPFFMDYLFQDVKTFFSIPVVSRKKDQSRTELSFRGRRIPGKIKISRNWIIIPAPSPVLLSAPSAPCESYSSGCRAPSLLLNATFPFI